MRTQHYVFCLVLVVLAGLACTPERHATGAGAAGTASPDHPSADLTGTEEGNSITFTYTLLHVDDTAAVTLVLKDLSVPNAITYALWTPLELADATPFAGLRPTQLALMLAWDDDTNASAILTEKLAGIDGILDLDTTLYESVYLSDGLRVPTAEGFYVQRDEWYQPEDVAQAVRLSKEAWTTFEPTFGVRVTGLFRKRPGATRRADVVAVASLLRIVWYPSEAAWLDSRNFQRDPESRRRFEQRREIQVPGSGIALATNRFVPTPALEN